MTDKILQLLDGKNVRLICEGLKWDVVGRFKFCRARIHRTVEHNVLSDGCAYIFATSDVHGIAVSGAGCVIVVNRR